MARLIVLALLLACVSLKAATANQILSQAKSLQGLSDKDLRIATAYSLSVYTGLAGLPVGSILASAYSQGFSGLSDQQLAQIQAYATSQGLVSIFVTPNTNSSTYGIQEALNAVPPGGPQWGTNVTGAHIQLAAGDYWVTNGAFYSNTFPYSIRMEGAGILATRLIYVSNNNTRTNLLRFCGGGNPNGGLMLPGQVELENMTFTSITNDIISLVCITNESYWRVAHCNFTGWEITTNNLHGTQLSIDGPYPTQPPGNVGLQVGSPLQHGGFLEDCFFANLATGISSWTDHLYIYGFKTAFIGNYSTGTPTDGTAWPNTSPYSLGASILINSGLNCDIINSHFYIVNAGVVADTGSPPETTIFHPQWEGADHSLACFAPSSWGLSIQELAVSDDATKWAVTHSPYAYSTTTAIPTRYTVLTKMLPAGSTGVGFDGSANTATNFARFSVQTNLIAAGFSPRFGVGYETVTTNGGPIIFGLASLPTGNAGDYVEHDMLVNNTSGSIQQMVFPAPYVTNALDSYRCTNGGYTFVKIKWVPNVITNVSVSPAK